MKMTKFLRLTKGFDADYNDRRKSNERTRRHHMPHRELSGLGRKQTQWWWIKTGSRA